ncbi:UNVERIFIED_CONTAM: hypothetical protein RMT77_016586 [Armadillidium vulgare]
MAKKEKGILRKLKKLGHRTSKENALNVIEIDSHRLLTVILCNIKEEGRAR